MANDENYQKNLKEPGDLCEQFYAPKIPEKVLKEGREFMAEIKRRKKEMHGNQVDFSTSNSSSEDYEPAKKLRRTGRKVISKERK